MPNRTGLRVMVDANILIAGSVWPRWPYEILQHAITGDIQLVLSQYVIDQARRQIQKSFPDDSWRFERFLELLFFEPVDDPSEEQISQFNSLVRDKTDLPLALAAINAKVDFLISEDKDLTTQDETTQELRHHLKVMISGTFLREVMGWTSDRLDKVRGRNWRDLEPRTDLSERSW